MKITVYDGIHLLNQATSLDELTRIYERLVAAYGFDQLSIIFTPEENKKTDNRPFAIATFEHSWINYYQDQGFHTIDPVVLTGMKQLKPFLWNNLWKGIEQSKRQVQFFNEASEHGVGTGAGFPIPLYNNEPGIVSLVSSYYKPSDIAKIMKEDHMELMLLATQYQHSVLKLLGKGQHPNAPDLSPREKECLTWAANGKTDIEIGIILDLSTRTVNGYMISAYRKLNCVSRSQAVLMAHLYRLISI